MSYKSIKSCGVKGIGRVETVTRDAFTENSVGKNIVIDGKTFIVKSIYTKGINVPENMIRLNVTTEWWENYKINNLK